MSNIVQSSYPVVPKRGLPGQPGTTAAFGEGITKVLESATAGFGLAVSRGTEKEKGCVLGGTDFIGITKADQTLDAATHATADQYKLGDNVGIQNDDDIWVTVGGNVTAGMPAYYNTSTGVISATPGTRIQGAEFQTNALSGEVALVRLMQVVGNTTV